MDKELKTDRVRKAAVASGYVSDHLAVIAALILSTTKHLTGKNSRLSDDIDVNQVITVLFLGRIIHIVKDAMVDALITNIMEDNAIRKLVKHLCIELGKGSDLLKMMDNGLSEHKDCDKNELLKWLKDQKDVKNDETEEFN